MRSLTFTTAIAAFLKLAFAATPAEWSQESIYQVMTDRFARPANFNGPDCDVMKYCGGTWSGLIDKLDYIQNMGFTAVYISPVTENIPEDTGYGEAYHGYWPNNLYGINDHFGSAGDLSHLSQALHDRGMKLMVDVVINDMAQAINGKMPQPIDYSKLQPFNDQKYYHSYCNITDYGNSTNAQDCYLGVDSVALVDLDTESNDVVDMIGKWVNQLVANYSIDGVRIDAAKHVNDEFLPPFVKNTGVFTFGEVYTGVVNDLCRYQDKQLVQGLNNYAVYFPMIRAFTAGKMKDLSQMISDVKDGCKDTSTLGTFAENHDLPRFATLVSDMALAANALAFTILADGIPLVYQGQEQHMTGNFSPFNRAPLWPTNYNADAPLYKLTATLNTLRNHAIKTDSHYVSNHSTELYLDDSTMATRKGPDGVQIVSVFSNQGSGGGKYELSVPGAFDPGVQVMEVMNCTKSTANKAGNITVQMGAGQPKVFFPMDQLDGSGLCGSSGKAANGSGSASGNSNSSSKPSAATVGAPVQASTLALSVLFGIAFWLL